MPPKYVRNLSKTGIPGTEDLKWLDVGLDFRTRWEYRENDLRRDEARTDNPFLFRTREYLGIRDILDPFRFVVEVEDARRYNSKFPKDNRDFNEFEPIQMIAEIYLKDALGVDALGQDRPLSVRGGRMWFEMLDRRLIGNNAWRNTTNTFQGLHVSAGGEVNDWQLQGIATQPLLREMFDFDSAIDGQYFFAMVGHWRKWSDVVTLEPYYLLLSQRAKEGRPERLIHAPALRSYGPIGATGFEYDFDLDFIGQEFDFRARYPICSRIDATFGYARFNNGNFVRNTTEGTGRGRDTNFFYVELTVNAFPKAEPAAERSYRIVRSYRAPNRSTARHNRSYRTLPRRAAHRGNTGGPPIQPIWPSTKALFNRSGKSEIALR